MEEQGEGTSTGGTEAVAGLAVLAVEVLSILAGDRTPGSLQTGRNVQQSSKQIVVIKAKQ